MVEVTATCVEKGDRPGVHRRTGSSRLTFAGPSDFVKVDETKSHIG